MTKKTTPGVLTGSTHQGRHKLFTHQVTALEKIKDEARVALFMEMRLGKTPVVIRWAKQWMTDKKRCLVVAPMSTLADWDEELRREGIRPRDIVHLEGIPSNKREEYYAAGWGWYLINYEAVRVTSGLTEVDWEVLICDESTYIRNPQAQITKVLVNEYSGVPYRAILSGDPVPEGPENYFSQFQFLTGSFMGFGNFWAWRNSKFNQNPHQTWEWTPRAGVRDEIKEWVHKNAIVMTRAQHGIGGHKVYERRRVDLNPAQQAAVKELTRKFTYDYIETNFATVRDVWLARVAGGFSPDRENPELLSNAKTAEIISLLKGELKKEQVVIWFRFNEELQHVWSALLKAGIRAHGVMGSTPVDQRKAIRDKFKRKIFQVLCVQIKIGRVGWDLSAARTAIYYSNSYAWEDRSQSEDRLVHPTKRDPLLYIDLVTKGTLDEEVSLLLRDKRSSSKAFMRQLNSAALDNLRRLYGVEGESESRTGLKAKTESQGKDRSKIRRVFPGSK